MIRYVSDTDDGSAHKFSDFVTTAEYHGTRIYRELYRRLRVEHQLAITLPVARPRIIGLALNRSRADDDFDERDRTMLNLLRPHLAQAYDTSVFAPNWSPSIRCSANCSRNRARRSSSSMRVLRPTGTRPPD